MAFESSEGDRLSQEPFLDKHSHPYNGRGEELDAAETSRQPFYCLIFSLSFNVVLLFITAALLYALHVNREANTDPSILLPLPARNALHWGTRQFSTNIVDNPFAGEPRPELEQAWHELLQNDNIQVLHQDLEALNLTSVYLKDGSGEIASLGVYHALHCLKKVRHMAYNEHYHQGKDDAARYRERRHADHCIEYLREYLMCKPDLSLVTYHWINHTAQHGDSSARFPTNRDHGLHECADWESLDAWAGNRVFDLYDTDLLEKPEHGLEYEDLS